LPLPLLLRLLQGCYQLLLLLLLCLSTRSLRPRQLLSNSVPLALGVCCPLLQRHQLLLRVLE
jgi:hypothetical protein